MGDSIISRIEKIKQEKTTKSQRILLNYFETVDHNKIMYMSITQLAEETGVAEATVLRFCRALGFNGYQEFKLNLAQDAATLHSKDAQVGEEVAEAAEEYFKALDLCRTNTPQSSIDRAVDMIVNSKRISCCGAGHSYLAALELHNRLMKMGILAYCERDMHFQNILVSTQNENDLLVVFSVSGCTKDVIEAAERAHALGVKIIVITSYDKSPLSRYADLVLASASMESPADPGAMSSIITQLFMVDVLCRALHGTDKAHFDALVARSNVATAGKLV